MFETLRKRLRGILGAGAIWGVDGGLVGSVLGLVLSLLIPGSEILGSILELGAGSAFVGLLSGIGFGTCVTLVAARERDAMRLGPGRGALLGLLGSLTLPAVIISQIPAGPNFVNNFVGILLTYGIIGAVGGATFLSVGRSATVLRSANVPLLPESDGI